jgi:fatty-acyl-CoA synthase
MSIYDALQPLPVCHAPLSPLRFLDRAETYFGDRIGLISGDTRLSWAEIADRIRRFANALKQLGVERGDTVSVIAPNGAAIFEAHFAVPMAGAVLNNINVRLDAETVTYILEHCEARVLLVDTEFSQLAREAVSAMASPPILIDIVDANGPGGERIGTTDYETMLAAASSSTPRAPPASPRASSTTIATPSSNRSATPSPGMSGPIRSRCGRCRSSTPMAGAACGRWRVWARPM